MYYRFRFLIPLLFAGLLAAAGCATSPPVQEMSDARQAIIAAQAADAANLAAESLAEAQRLLTLAERFLRNESFGSARNNALRAKNRALQALEMAQVASGSASN